MGYELREERRKQVWHAMSWIFNDMEVDYEFIASQVSGIDIQDLERIFFEEVAPFCAPNALSVIPEIWAGFDPEALADGVLYKLEKKNRSLFALMKYRISVWFCRLYFRRDWMDLKAAIERLKKSN